MSALESFLILKHSNRTCFIFLLGLTKFKIEGRGDVEKLTRLPIVGDVPLTDEKTGSITVFENQKAFKS